MSDSQFHAPAVVAPETGVDAYRQSTNAATLCRAIVLQTAQKIQGKRYVPCVGWQAIAVAHGCTASARSVEVVEGGVRAIGEVRRMDNGAVIAEAEGFVGDDEQMWAKRPTYARRAMAQTRAMSRACRSAFAHVVTMIDNDLGTTPAEEMAGVIDNDGPGSSWGAGGKQSAVDEAERDGLRANAPAEKSSDKRRREEQAAKTKAKVDDALATFNMVGQSADILKAYWAANEKAFQWISDNFPAEYERLSQAYDDALSAASDRAA
jgi:hypothetical protein